MFGYSLFATRPARTVDGTVTGYHPDTEKPGRETAGPLAATSAEDWIAQPASSFTRDETPVPASARLVPGSVTAAIAEPAIASAAATTATWTCRRVTSPPAMHEIV